METGTAAVGLIAMVVGLASAACGVSGGAPRDDDDDTSGATSSTATTSAAGEVGAAATGAGGASQTTGVTAGVGGGVGGGAQGGAAPDYLCDGSTLLGPNDDVVASYDDAPTCSAALAAMNDGFVCAWFTPGMNIGPEAWDETGWRAMNAATGMGLGRRPHVSFDDCLAATENARGGVVCTNTGVGYKAAHRETNQWCGASSALSYCLEATLGANDFHVCSFPSDGDGSGPGWVLTHIDGSTCDYLTTSMPLSECNGLVP